MTALTTAQGFVALLDEEVDDLRVYALEQLNATVNLFWAEIASCLGKIEAFADDAAFPRRKLAYLVASKVRYHLGDFKSAMENALGAGDLFAQEPQNEYVETLVCKFVDEYIQLRLNGEKIDDRLQAIVEQMFEQCFTDKKYKEALGIGMESGRLDKVEEAITKSNDTHPMLQYAFKAAMTVVPNRVFRHQVLRKLIELYSKLEKPDYLNICRILVFLVEPAAVAGHITTLISGNEDDELLAYQIGFDLCNNGTQQFRKNVRKHLEQPKKVAAATTATTTPSSQDSQKESESGGDAMEVDDDETTKLVKQDTKEAKPETDDPFQQRLRKIHSILSGEIAIALYLDFLSKHQQSDLLILKKTKNALDTRNSVVHSALIYSNAIMHAGTTRDTFLRENLEWLGRAANWAKFSATAGLGVIHKGHIKEGLQLLKPYLPGSSGGAPSPYSEGGALFALGLIHANHGEEITKFLVNILSDDEMHNEFIQHGGCLGLGVSAMASGDTELYEQLKNVLHNDNAIAGEAAGLAMGLVMLGSANEACHQEMLAYAHETQHEKIIRGLSLGIALVMYAREEEADALIDQLLDKEESDPIIRYGAMYCIGLAYCGTGNNKAMRKLLHYAVSDVSDDVRRVAVMCLGFVLTNNPSQCPKMVSLLSASYNPHVRYGATLAIGIACAGTGMQEAVDVLMPMARNDTSDFVRQGAFIALAMVLIQRVKATDKNVDALRSLLQERIGDKHEATMAKFGAILAQGILDAGGRNATISLHSRSGHRNLSAIIGIAVFTHFWCWYPLIHFFSLALTPTVCIGVNKDMKVPKFEFKSNAPPSHFAYPEKLQEKKEEAPTKVATAVLSTTKKAKKRQAKKQEEKKKESDDMDTTAEEQKAETEDKKEDSEKQETADKKADDTTATTATVEKKEEQKEKEADYQLLSNPSRVTTDQISVISLDVDDRYKPVSTSEIFGITLLKDTKPTEKVVLACEAETSADKSSTTDSTDSSKANSNSAPIVEEDDEDEPDPPPSFEFRE